MLDVDEGFLITVRARWAARESCGPESGCSLAGIRYDYALLAGRFALAGGKRLAAPRFLSCAVIYRRTRFPVSAYRDDRD